MRMLPDTKHSREICALRQAAATVELFTGHQCGVAYVAFRGALRAGLATHAVARDVAQLLGVPTLHRARLGFTPILIIGD